MRFERQAKAALRITLLSRLRLGRQQHRAAAICRGFVDEAMLLGKGQRLHGGGPVFRLAMQIEQCVHGPAQLWIESQCALGKLTGCFRLAFALRFQE